MASVEITLNNQKRKIEGTLTLQELIRSLPIQNLDFGVAACLNGDVIEKNSWGLITLKKGDRVDVLRAFQGG